MLRILHTIDTTGPGGAETVFINLIKGLDPDRYHSIAAIRGPGWVCDTLRKNNIEPLFIPSRGGFNFQYLLALIRIIRQHKIDIVQSHLFGSNVYCSLAGMICRVPVISTFHGFVDTSNSERLMSLKSSIINLGSRKIIFVSNQLSEHYVNKFGFSSQKAVTIYNGVDTSIFYPKKNDSIRNELGLCFEHVLIGALGNIRPAKGYDIFLKAARLVHDMYPKCRFLIAGHGSGKLFDSLLKLRKDLDLDKVFFFIGFRSNAAQVLNNLDIFVLPSKSEGFSISTIEALACNLPIVVTRCGGPQEIISNGVDGFVTECNEYDLAEAIIYLNKNNELKTKTSIYAREKSYDFFSILTMINKYQKIYEKNSKK